MIYGPTGPLTEERTCKRGMVSYSSHLTGSLGTVLERLVCSESLSECTGSTKQMSVCEQAMEAGWVKGTAFSISKGASRP